MSTEITEITAPKKHSRLACIKNYFGDRQDQNAGMWMTELKALSSAEKDELATGAAKALGLSQDQCDFVFHAQ